MANLFTSQTPSSGDNSDGTPGIVTATTVRFAQNGNVTGIRFYATATVGGTYTGLLWHVDAADSPSPAGTLLASKTLGVTPTGGTWNTITFDSQVAVTTGNLYRAGLFSGDGRYVATLNFFTVDLVNGDITADANGDDPVTLGSLRQGTFNIGAAPAFPSSPGNATCYFVDVAFTTGGSEVNGAAALAETASLAASSVVDRNVSAALTATSTMAAAGVVDRNVSSATAVTAGLAAAAGVDHRTSASLTVTTALTAAPEPSTVTTSRGNWWSIGTIAADNFEERRMRAERGIVDCPNHLEPLQEGVRPGVLHCPFGGELFDRHGNPVYQF